MKNLLRKDFYREIRKNTGRFLSIFFIVMLGTAFFAGVRSSGGDMKYTADDVFRRSKMMDIRVLGTLGLTDSDLRDIQAIDSVERAVGGHTKEVLVNRVDEQLVIKLIAITEGINEAILTEGRFPENAHECLADNALSEHEIGDVIRVESGTEDEITDDLNVTEFTIVGKGNLPYYLDLTRGAGTIGNGTISAFLMIPDEAFCMDIYTEIYVQVKGADAYSSYSDEYEELVDAAADEIKAMEETITVRRYNEVISEGEDKIADAREEIADGLKELEDARTELDDAKKELADAEEELADGKTELDDAKKELDDGEKKLDDAKKELDDGEKELADAKKELDDGEAELSDAKKELDDGETKLNDAKKELDEGETELSDAKKELDDGEQQLADAKTELDDGEKELADAKKELDDGEQELDDAKKELDEGEKELADAKKELTEGKTELDDGEKQLAEAKEQLDESAKQIEEGEKQLADAKKQLDEKKPELEAAAKTLEEGRKELDDAKQQLEEGKKQLEEAKNTLDAAEDTLSKNQEELDAAKEELAAGKTQLEEGWAEYETGAAQLEELAGILDTVKGIYDTIYGQLLVLQQMAEADPDNPVLSAQIAALSSALEWAKTQIDAGEASYNEAKATLDAGYEELVKNQAAWDEGAAQIAAAEEALSDGWAEYNAGKEEYEENLAAYEDAVSEYEAGEKEYESGLAQYEEGKSQYDAGAAAYEEAKKELEAGRKQYEEGLAAYEEALAEWEKGKNQYEEGLEEYEKGRTDWEDGKQQYEEGLSAWEDGKQQYEEGLAEWEDGKQQYEEGLSGWEDGKQQYEEGLAGWEDGKQQYEEGLAEWEDGKRQYEEGLAEWEDGKQQYEESLAEWEDGKKQYEDSLKEYEDGRKKYENGLKEYEDGRKEYEDGLKEYEDGEKKYAEEYAEHMPELEDGIRETDDAEEELRKVKVPDLYVLDRGMIQSTASYGQDAERMDSLGNVFPVIFFLVAALVSLTAMTRMVDEQRQQIGTLKALGFSGWAITWKYLKYALIPSFTGGVIGVFLGEYIIPKVILESYRVMYTGLDKTLIPFNAQQGILAVVIACACTSLAAMVACYRKLKDRPAQLMRPEAPKSGRRVFLEYVPPLWNRMNFTAKSTVRNLFRYKKRLFMTIIGIGACMGLMMVGFGIYDSITDVAKRQYREIFMQDATVSIDMNATRSELRRLNETIDSMEDISASMDLCEMSATLHKGKTDRSAVLYIPEDKEKVTEFLRFQSRVTREPYDFPAEGVGLAEKTADMLGVKVGDTITVQKGESGAKAETTVAVIVENYVQHYCFMTQETYQSLFGEEPEMNEILLDYEDNSKEHEKKIGKILVAESGCTSVSFTTDFQKQIDDMLAVLIYVIWILIISAGLLAFVVVYNLNNINILERKRELATLKVLGFRDTEVAMYVYRENIVLTLLGIVLGCFAGMILHQFTIRTVEVDLMMFGRVVRTGSYVISALLTLLFAFIVNAAMYFSLKKIDMIESLKSVE